LAPCLKSSALCGAPHNAQFEREIISERTRDKMSAARRKGKWVGGTPVLGYDVDVSGRRLVVNEKEARRVRETFELYRMHRSLAMVVSELERRGWKTKSWVSKSGVRHSGRAFAKASLRRLLTNAVYAGNVEHKGSIYPGEHAAIVEQPVWDEVNAKCRASRRARPTARRTKQNPLLAGLLVCTSCRLPMIATYTSKNGRRYRYYVCQAARQNGWHGCPTKSVPAPVIEDSVVARLHAALRDETWGQFRITEAERQKLQAGDAAVLVRTLVQQIDYD
jgi:site-specific DNA recombinase